MFCVHVYHKPPAYNFYRTQLTMLIIIFKFLWGSLCVSVDHTFLISYLPCFILSLSDLLIVSVFYYVTSYIWYGKELIVIFVYSLVGQSGDRVGV